MSIVRLLKIPFVPLEVSWLPQICMFYILLFAPEVIFQIVKLLENFLFFYNQQELLVMLWLFQQITEVSNRKENTYSTHISHCQIRLWVNVLLQFLLSKPTDIFGYLFIDTHNINVFSESFGPRMTASVSLNNFSEATMQALHLKVPYKRK